MKQTSADIGLAPKGLLADARPGAVYTVSDEAIALPETRIPRAPERTVHPERRIILVQPILKSDVVAYCGQLTDASLDLLLARLLENLGVRAPLMAKLPPRLAAESAAEAQ